MKPIPTCLLTSRQVLSLKEQHNTKILDTASDKITLDCSNTPNETCKHLNFASWLLKLPKSSPLNAGDKMLINIAILFFRQTASSYRQFEVPSVYILRIEPLKIGCY